MLASIIGTAGKRKTGVNGRLSVVWSQWTDIIVNIIRITMVITIDIIITMVSGHHYHHQRHQQQHQHQRYHTSAAIFGV